MKKIYEFNYYYNAIDVYEVNSIYKYYANSSWIGEIRTSLCTMFYSHSVSKSSIYLKCEVSFFEEGIEFLFSEEEKSFFAYDEIESCFNYDGYIVFLLKESINHSALEIYPPFIMYRNFDKKVLNKLNGILSEKVENCKIDLDEVNEVKKRVEKLEFIGGLITVGFMLLVIGLFILFVAMLTPPNEFRTLNRSSNVLNKEAKTIRFYEKGLDECYGKHEGKGCSIIAEKLLNLKSNYNLKVLDFNRALNRSEWDSCTKEKNSSGLYAKVVTMILPKECAVYKTFTTVNEMK